VPFELTENRSGGNRLKRYEDLEVCRKKIPERPLQDIAFDIKQVTTSYMLALGKVCLILARNCDSVCGWPSFSSQELEESNVAIQ